MELTDQAGCTHEGVSMLHDRGWVFDDVRFHHRPSLCDAYGKIVIPLTVRTQDFNFEFPIASTEAVETLSTACADSRHATHGRREFACASHKEGEVSEIRRYPTYPTGWLCPKCGRIYAPFVVQCMTCGVAKISPKAEDTTDGTQLLNEVA